MITNVDNKRIKTRVNSYLECRMTNQTLTKYCGMQQLQHYPLLLKENKLVSKIQSTSNNLHTDNESTIENPINLSQTKTNIPNLITNKNSLATKLKESQ